MNKKGQALIEFVLILPVILLVLISLIDIGNIFMEKYKLNSDVSAITEMYENGKLKEAKALAAKDNITVTENVKNDMLTITANKNITVSTPILKNVLGKSFKISTSQTVYLGGENDEQ